MSVLSKQTFGCLGLAIGAVIAWRTPEAHAQDWACTRSGRRKRECHVS